MSDPSMEVWKGYFLASLFFISSAFQSLTYQLGHHLPAKVSIRFRAGLIDVLYRKALTISPFAAVTTGIGDMVNLMAVDMERLQLTLIFIWIIWWAPLNIIIALVLLYFQLGWVCFVGLGVMIISFIINGVLASLFESLQVFYIAASELHPFPRRIPIFSQKHSYS